MDKNKLLEKLKKWAGVNKHIEKEVRRQLAGIEDVVEKEVKVVKEVVEKEKEIFKKKKKKKPKK